MYLSDRLPICLLAYDSRYPRHAIDINQAVLEIYDVARGVWLEMRELRVREIIATLAEAAPALLESPAVLHLEGCDSAIYLPEYSRMEPAFYLRCSGIMMLKIEYLER